MTEMRTRGRYPETWEERFPRYARNAALTAEVARERAEEMLAAAVMHRRAAVNADAHGDRAAADLYDEMAKAAEDATDALEDIADLALRVAAHYTTTPLEDQTDG
jgi:hypothetical protein